MRSMREQVRERRVNGLEHAFSGKKWKGASTSASATATVAAEATVCADDLQVRVVLLIPTEDGSTVRRRIRQSQRSGNCDNRNCEACNLCGGDARRCVTGAYQLRPWVRRRQPESLTRTKEVPQSLSLPRNTGRQTSSNAIAPSSYKYSNVLPFGSHPEWQLI